MTRRVTRGSNDVFRQLGFGKREAGSRRIRAELMVAITRLIRSRKLTQAKAAALMGVTQPRVSDLVRGRIDLFSIDTLVDMATRAGAEVRLRIKAAHGSVKGRRAA